MADANIERAQEIIRDEIAKATLSISLELIKKYGPARATIIAAYTTPLVKDIAEHMAKMPPEVLLDVTIYARDILNVAVKAGEGFVAMVEEIQKPKA